MGITIHFTGTIEPSHIPDLVAEMKNIANHYGWGYTTMWDGEIGEHVPLEPEEEPSPEEERDACHIEDTVPVSGIILHPDAECESLSLLFDKDGKLTSLINWLLMRDGVLEPEDAWVFVKTQFTRPEVHVTIVELLKYLKKHYLKTLEVQDEGQYYETGDIGKLKDLRAKINRWIDKIASDFAAAESPSESEQENPDALADRIEKSIRDLWERER
jgi:hypothetical protein